VRPLTIAVAVSIAVAVTIGFASCSGDAAAPAPEPGATQTVCLPEFCVDYPTDWEVTDVGADFVLLAHPGGAEASVGPIDMQGVTESAGGSWPQDAEDTVRSFWMLLDELGDAELDRVAVTPQGAVDSEGKLDGRTLWHRLLPADPPRAIGAELRADDSSWDSHAVVIVGSLRGPANS
jgi:hypothetical protein